jgi:release factor glutamine methyltransferase
VPSARHDAEALARSVAGDDDRLDVAAYDDLVARRAAREPLQHLIGTAAFRHLELCVGPGVFVPRPETEGLVDLVLPGCGPGRRAIDLCAGSGAIAIALATEAPGTDVVAVEVSPEALPWLRRNVAALAPHDVDIHAGSVDDALGDLFADVLADVVVSNPPYLPDGWVVDPEVEADPAIALWGGPDGLTVIRAVVVAAARLLRPGGLVAVEHDASHQPAVLDCLRRKGFVDVRGHRDLTGRDRYATGVRMSA